MKERGPKMIRKVQKSSRTVSKITVRNKTLAEIPSAKPEVAPGEAVRKLIQLREKLSCLKGKSKELISRRVKDYLYVRGSR